MSLSEATLTPTQRDLQQRHIERRLRLASAGVHDRPINLKFKHGIDPDSIKIDTVDKPVRLPLAPPCISATEGYWPSLEPWGALPRQPYFNQQVPPNFYTRIKRLVGNYFDVSIAEIDGKDRGHARLIPRHVAMYLAKTLIKHSLPEVGRRFGGKDHTTILNCMRKMDGRMKRSSDLCQTVIELQAELQDDIDRWRASICR